jgi:hypothetical protein
MVTISADGTLRLALDFSRPGERRNIPTMSRRKPFNILGNMAL